MRAPRCGRAHFPILPIRLSENEREQPRCRLMGSVTASSNKGVMFYRKAHYTSSSALVNGLKVPYLWVFLRTRFR